MKEVSTLKECGPQREMRDSLMDWHIALGSEVRLPFLSKRERGEVVRGCTTSLIVLVMRLL